MVKKGWVITLRNIDDETVQEEWILSSASEEQAIESGDAALKRNKHKHLYWTIQEMKNYER